jgi:hypothetical protein
MLKISFSETPAEERWILHGLLTDPWVHTYLIGIALGRIGGAGI